MPRGSGCGPDRFFNEYLILLTRGYDDAEAASAMLRTRASTTTVSRFYASNARFRANARPLPLRC